MVFFRVWGVVVFRERVVRVRIVVFVLRLSSILDVYRVVG